MDQSFNWARPARSRVDHRVEDRRSTQASCGATVGADALWLSRPGKPCSVCSEIVRKGALSDYIEMLLDALARPINFSHHHTWIKLTARDFDGASPWLNEFIELAGGDEGLIDPSYHPSEVNWPITTRTISLDIDRPGNLAVSICRGLSPRDVRGRDDPGHHGDGADRHARGARRVQERRDPAVRHPAAHESLTAARRQRV